MLASSCGGMAGRCRPAHLLEAAGALDDTLMLIGKRPGTTNVVALAADGSQMANTLVRVERADSR